MNVVVDNLGLYLGGMRTTVTLTVLSFLGALVIGVAVASCRVSPVAPLRAVATLYVGAIRNSPLAVLLFLFFFGLTKVGLLYTPFVSALVVLALYTGAFVAETVRAGINAVAAGQAEAARALGLSFGQTLRAVILPQALRTVTAPLGGVFIALIKNSSLAFLISVVDLAGVAEKLNTATARPIPVFIGAALGYLVLAVPSGLMVNRLEARVAIRR